VAPQIEGFVEFLAGADFDFDGESAGARAFEGVADAARRGDGIVLESAWRRTGPYGDCNSAGGRGGLLQGAKAGSGFPCVEDLAACAFDGGREMACGGGDAAEALQEIQGDALTGE